MSHQESARDTDNRRLRANSPSSYASVSLTENTRQWFIAVAVSLSIAVNVVVTVLLIQTYRHKEQAEDLKRYDLDFFKQNDWTNLRTQVEVNERLLTIMGKCPK